MPPARGGIRNLTEKRTHTWQNAFHRLARCYERRTTVIDTCFDLADTIITLRSLIRQAWTTHRWEERPDADHDLSPVRADSKDHRQAARAERWVSAEDQYSKRS